MYPGAAGEVTGLLQQMRGGDADAVDRLVPIVIWTVDSRVSSEV